jgi:hypothetical protein
MRSGRPVRFGSWHLSTDLLVLGDLDTQIRNLFDSLSPDMAVWKNLTGQHRADLFCGLFLTENNQGLELSPDTIAAIAQRGLKLSLDIYGSSDPDEPRQESTI